MTTMHDETRQRLIAAYYDGELEQARRGEVERLLRDDPQAAADLAELRQLSATLQGLKRPHLDAAALADVHRRIDDRIADPVIARITRWTAAAAAAILIGSSTMLMTQMANGGEVDYSDPVAEGVALLNSPAMGSRDTGPAPEVEISQWIVAGLTTESTGETP